MLKVRVASVRHLEGLIDRLGEHGEMDSYVVLSTAFEGRPVEPPADEARPVTGSTGWSRVAPRDPRGHAWRSGWRSARPSATVSSWLGSGWGASGPLRSSTPQMSAPAAKMPAAHQNPTV
jgi:hypothetical protein